MEVVVKKGGSSETPGKKRQRGHEDRTHGTTTRRFRLTPGILSDKGKVDTLREQEKHRCISEVTGEPNQKDIHDLHRQLLGNAAGIRKKHKAHKATSTQACGMQAGTHGRHHVP